MVASMLSANAKPEASLQEVTQSAKNGDAAAQLELAIRYRDGLELEANPVEAMVWARRAADQGNKAAMAFIARAYDRGAGVQANKEIALGYYRAAADESADAAYQLGYSYFSGLGVDQNVPKALAYWEKASELGHGRAAAIAAMTYHAGEGVEPDAEKARRLATRAMELGDPSGFVFMGELHYQAGEYELARACWTKVAAPRQKGPSAQSAQPTGKMSTRQGADLLELMDWRQRAPERGRFALVKLPHIHQGHNNCGSSSCAMVARYQGVKISGWGFKHLCPSPVGTGTDWDDLLNAARAIKLSWRLVNFTPDDEGFRKGEEFLKSELDAGRPVIIDFLLVGPQYSGGEAGHTLTVVGYIAEKNQYILCNPAIATPGLQLMDREEFDRLWRSHDYSWTAHHVMSRPALAIDFR